MSDTCKDCRFYVFAETGECHRFPAGRVPVQSDKLGRYMDANSYPRVLGDRDWCGEFRPREPKRTGKSK